MKNKFQILIMLLILIGTGNLFNLAARKWSLSTGMQYTLGNYIFEKNSTAVYLYGGIGYAGERWNFSASIPMIVQNSDLITQSGGMFFPAGESHGNGESGHGMGHHSGNGSLDSTMNHFNMAVGDLYVSGRRQLRKESDALPSLSLKVDVKVPTAGTKNNYGSGKFDYGASLNFSKGFATLQFFLDAGFLVLGDPAGITYKNPLTFGLGIGKFFAGGKISTLFYYNRYSNVLQNYRAPGQISGAIYYKLNQSVLLSGNLAFGLSEISPDFSLFSGLDFIL